MQINIKKLDGQKEEFSLEPSDSVMKVKEMLAEKTGVHKDQIRLIFKGKPMLDDKVRSDITSLRTSRHATPRHARARVNHSQTVPAPHAASKRSGPRQRTGPSLNPPSHRPMLLPLCVHQSLDEQDVKAGNTVHMIMQMRGGH